MNDPEFDRYGLISETAILDFEWPGSKPYSAKKDAAEAEAISRLKARASTLFGDSYVIESGFGYFPMAEGPWREGMGKKGNHEPKTCRTHVYARPL